MNIIAIRLVLVRPRCYVYISSRSLHFLNVHVYSTFFGHDSLPLVLINIRFVAC